MTNLTVPDLTTLVGLLAITLVTVQIIKGAWAPPAATISRFGPLLAVAVGVVWALLARIVIGPVDGSNLLNAVLSGIVVGAAAAGLYDVATSQKGTGGTDGIGTV